MTINRRQFLQRAGATGGALAAAAALPACHTVFPVGYQSKQNLLDRPAAESQIDTIVIVMMENRSFDHWLGWLGNDQAYLATGAQHVRQVLPRERRQPPDLRRADGSAVDPAHDRVGLPDEPVPRLRPVGPEPRVDRRSGPARPRVHRGRTRTRTCCPSATTRGGTSRSPSSSSAGSRSSTTTTRRSSAPPGRTATTCTPRSRAVASTTPSPRPAGSPSRPSGRSSPRRTCRRATTRATCRSWRCSGPA